MPIDIDQLEIAYHHARLAREVADRGLANGQLRVGSCCSYGTLTVRRRIRDLVTDSLARWEKRVTVDRVEVRELPDEPTRIRVEIAYRLKRTGTAQQLGLTMELED